MVGNNLLGHMEVDNMTVDILVVVHSMLVRNNSVAEHMVDKEAQYIPGTL